MPAKQDAPFASYETWFEFITQECGKTLTSGYCQERIAELRNPDFPATKSFVQFYGTAYRDQVISWFERASALSS